MQPIKESDQSVVVEKKFLRSKTGKSIKRKAPNLKNRSKFPSNQTNRTERRNSLSDGSSLKESNLDDSKNDDSKTENKNSKTSSGTGTDSEEQYESSIARALKDRIERKKTDISSGSGGGKGAMFMFGSVKKD